MLGLMVATLEVRRAEDIEPAFGVLKGRLDALYVAGRMRSPSKRISEPR